MAMLQLTHILYTCKHPAKNDCSPLVLLYAFPHDMISLFGMCGHTRAHRRPFSQQKNTITE